MTPRRVECHLMKYAKGLRGNRNNLVAIIETQEVLGGRGSMATGCVNMDCPWRSDKTKTDMFEVVMGEIDGVQGVVECFRVRGVTKKDKNGKLMLVGAGFAAGSQGQQKLGCWLTATQEEVDKAEDRERSGRLETRFKNLTSSRRNYDWTPNDD